MDETRRMARFAQGFEMLPPEEAFLSWWSYTELLHGNRYGPHRFAIFEIDSTRALLIGGSGLYDIYTIQNGIAVQQRSFPHSLTAGSGFHITESGTIRGCVFGSNNQFYHFVDGTLQPLAISEENSGPSIQLDWQYVHNFGR